MPLAASLAFGALLLRPTGAIAQTEGWQEVLKMGHRRWMKAQAAKGRDLADAETEYCIALHERTQQALARATPEEASYLDERRARFADLAKTCFNIGLERCPNWEGWRLAIAESSTAVNRAVWDLMKAEPDQPVVLKHASLAKARELGSVKGESSRLGTLLAGLDRDLCSRSSGEQAVAWQFAYQMVEMAAADRK